MRRIVIIKGVVINKIKGFYYVEDQKRSVYECRLRGILKRNDNKENCVVGDSVEIGDDLAIEKIFPRKNMLERPLVANIDNIIIQFSGKDPQIDYFKLNILVLNSFFNKVPPIILINKIDLLDENELDTIKKNLTFLNTINVPIFYISVKKNINLDKLMNKLQAQITAFSGPSGVGKSTMINQMQNKIEMETGETSKKLKRGKHTTRETRLIHFGENGYIIDTPGFSSIELPNILDFHQLIGLFPEFNDPKIKCKFLNCQHLNEPKCGIKELVEKNTIYQTRYDFYKEVYLTMKNTRWNKYER